MQLKHNQFNIITAMHYSIKGLITPLLLSMLSAIIPTHNLHAQDSNQVIHLWQNGAPGFENLKDEPEEAKEYWAKHINNPSITVYQPAKEKANGTAVIICPGGGHNKLVITSEGKDAAAWFNSIGITAFVLKYRLFREDDSPYKPEHAAADGRRAVQVVRQHAARWNIDTSRIGMMGFSAGGELAGWVAFDGYPTAVLRPDSTDQQNSRPDFLMLVYPGPLVVSESIGTNAPPLFMVAANDDECCSEPMVRLLQLYRKAGVKTEMHLYAQGNHAFNMGTRSKLKSIHDWPQRLKDWLMDNEWIKQ